MRKFLAASLVGLALFVVPSMAQAQCLLCGAVGYMIGSAGTTASANVSNSGLSGDVLYIMPRAGERVTDPLGARQVGARIGVGTNNIAGNVRSSLQEVFARAMTDSQNYEILSVQRFFRGESIEGNNVTLLFTFIEGSKITPLDRLPPREQK